MNIQNITEKRFKKKKQPKVSRLYNLVDKKVLKKIYEKDNTPRKTLSFYKYTKIESSEYLQSFRKDFFLKLSKLNILGRIYLASEGINAQVSVPLDVFDKFTQLIHSYDFLSEINFNEAVEEKSFSFYKLIIKIRKKIVADGLDDLEIDLKNCGIKMEAMGFNKALEHPDTIVVDVRNHYENEIGRFENAIRVDCDTFSEQLPMIKDTLKSKKNHKILLYCTGGIRCEKASAFLKQSGFKDVGQLKGGIINYAKQVKKKNLPNYFKGKNFVFDNRLGERITSDVLSHCHQCGITCDDHCNCANDSCHLLFIQCSSCKKKSQGCCSSSCQEFINLPIEEQRKRRKGKKKDSHAVYKSRIRPRLAPLK